MAYVKTIFSKAGAALSVADNAGAKGTEVAKGAIEAVPFQVDFTRGGANDLKLNFEGTIDGTTWFQVASRRADTDAVGTPVHTFAATGTYAVVVELGFHVRRLRPVAYMSGGPHANDAVVIKDMERE